MEDVLVPIAVVGILFVAFPAIIFHFMIQWKRARTLSIDDENLLDELHETARRLDDRLCSIERIIAADNPQWRDNCAELPRSSQRANLK